MTSLKILFIGVIIAVIVGGVAAAFWQYATPIQPSGPVTVTDDLGRTVTLTSYPPERIVSLAPSTTEILFALGLGDKVVGVDTYSDYPPEAADIEPKVGGFANINIEVVVGLEPDLVLATGGVQEKFVERLEELGITVIALSPQDMEDILNDIILVGEATGREEAAEKLVEELRQRIAAITEKTEAIPREERPKVYYEVWHDPLMSAGPGSFAHSLIELAGGVNIFEDAATKYPEVSLETVLSRNPDVIIITPPDAPMPGVSPEELKARPGWSEIEAVKNDRIYQIHPDLLSRPGPRIVNGLEALAKAIHPELFEQ
ncbi:cobalamin-binding protein [Candidatus Hecatella orcuttiae]|jgi:iron complex transport system substrate-binding protein|uniref:ABC transporter substrate-binding protein n=1 Tax=Candidatus Hecatella orcuttiae TaxID=1935119 RepID=UPI002867B642|nr:cobalamin-binding protein [Candidatus Hecatella orcuttiae]